MYYRGKLREQFVLNNAIYNRQTLLLHPELSDWMDATFCVDFETALVT